LYADEKKERKTGKEIHATRPRSMIVEIVANGARWIIDVPGVGADRPKEAHHRDCESSDGDFASFDTNETKVATG